MHQFGSILGGFNGILVLAGSWRHKLPRGYLFGPIEIVFFLVTAPIFQGRAGAIFFEQPIEICHVVETGAVANLIDGRIGAQQQFTGMANPHIQQKLGKTLGGVFLKKMTKSRTSHVDQSGDVANFNLTVGEIF